MKHVVEYSTVNPAYAESRGMLKATIVFVAFIVILSFL